MTKPLARVLVVEDELLLAQSIQVALGWRRVEAEHCGTAEEALAILNTETYDLLLLDIRLPGMSGLDLVTEVRANPALRRVPVVFMTGDTNPANRQAARRLGAADFLEKPLNMDKFVACILGHLKLEPSRRPKLPVAWKRKEP
ncbi:MAG: response regulator receiver [Limisphaerales bacterium]|nr:MAG: response regulator receiver [Limisphaerales bacterium]TXT45883.1 MAG: response regulator receiver [Limisphaerales bacterium]